MADERLRALEKRASGGGPSDHAAFLRERVRLGLLDSERLLLAAYCEAEAAREAVGWPLAPVGWWDPRLCDKHHVPPTRCCDGAYTSSPHFSGWISGLSRWPGALVRAAVAAGWVALRAHRCRECIDWAGFHHLWAGFHHLCRSVTAGHKAICAAEEWLKCPCEEHLENLLPFTGDHYGDGSASTPSFALNTARAVALLGGASGVCAETPGQAARTAVEDAARLTDEPTVRTAICEALISWSLR